MNLKRYEKLKADADRLRQEASRAEGALEQLMGRLKDEFGFTTLRQAERAAKKLAAESAEAEREFDRELDEFEREWSEVLNDA